MNRENNQQNFMQEEKIHTDTLDQLLWSAYAQETVPNEVKVRMKNRLECQRAMGTEKVSFWWLPATLATAVSFAMAAFLLVVYVVVNITGTQTWMPNLVQFVSEIWLKIHFAIILLEVVASWMMTILAVWKGNLVKSARMM